LFDLLSTLIKFEEDFRKHDVGEEKLKLEEKEKKNL